MYTNEFQSDCTSYFLAVLCTVYMYMSCLLGCVYCTLGVSQDDSQVVYVCLLRVSEDDRWTSTWLHVHSTPRVSAHWEYQRMTDERLLGYLYTAHREYQLTESIRGWQMNVYLATCTQHTKSISSLRVSEDDRWTSTWLLVHSTPRVSAHWEYQRMTDEHLLGYMYTAHQEYQLTESIRRWQMNVYLATCTQHTKSISSLRVSEDDRWMSTWLLVHSTPRVSAHWEYQRMTDERLLGYMYTAHQEYQLTESIRGWQMNVYLATCTQHTKSISSLRVSEDDRWTSTWLLVHSTPRVSAHWEY